MKLENDNEARSLDTEHQRSTFKSVSNFKKWSYKCPFDVQKLQSWQKTGKKKLLDVFRQVPQEICHEHVEQEVSMGGEEKSRGGDEI